MIRSQLQVILLHIIQTESNVVNISFAPSHTNSRSRACITHRLPSQVYSALLSELRGLNDRHK